MKRSWNGFLALGRTMAGLEGRSREFRVLHDGLPRFDGPSPKAKSTGATKASAVKSANSTAAQDQHSSAQGTPPQPTQAQTKATPASSPSESPSPIATVRPRPTSAPARPVVRRSRAWRWFGWFRQRPVGHGKPEQIELRLEDVRPVRSTLEGEDFIVVENQNSRPVMARRNPFASTGRSAVGAVEGPASSEPVSETPHIATGEANGPMNRLARWFRNRETTALK